MCRLALKTANEPFSPYEVLTAMEAMKEGYDGSGLGLLLRGLRFDCFKYNSSHPVLSGIAHSEDAWKRLNTIMEQRGYELIHDHKFVTETSLIEAKDRYRYFLRVYKMPADFEQKSEVEIENELMLTRLFLRANGEENGNDLTAFSFWPDVAIIKEVGWPLEIGEALALYDNRLTSRVCMAQGRQNTNYGINLYACHPFFIQGIATMTNGENTAFVPIRDWLLGQHFPGYTGYQSDSEVFAHILHYTLKQLKLPLQAYKHIITPLNNAELSKHPQGAFLKGLRNACRRLIIDGPNAVIGTLPDETCLLVMDQKKMRPATVGGRDGAWAMASEMCGVAAMIPDRDPSLDFQPMREHTIIVPPDRKELTIWSQLDPYPLAQVA
ncbi:MAG: glutamine amidotransferase family protein [Proteobacteria bacterium]|jgi:glutamate synthase domain-containing protein 1|nr:glutamate synthase [Desulfocapsa sp.]MBU3944709.1 glutamine amidotransferase family protein [Pseudomonadota bacterium]MCG2742629.1 glutamine amidotransferase family protein [Desulfobacteraceae bacterium]MBU3982453.1 glutamine amidotransferase family protein [Pseudomonadota bacterium]MBU4030355.1 glutamine amidotransferase family protein [Pseudomonadota bacterium]